jgi:hypothetical protein
MGKLAEGARTKVAQLMVLQMSPDILRRVELGSIGGEIRKREGMAQCAGDDFQGRLRESAEVCPA